MAIIGHIIATVSSHMEVSAVHFPGAGYLPDKVILLLWWSRLAGDRILRPVWYTDEEAGENR
ncbi:MAG: hypothetical protein K6G83_13840 [Lachnospiraceae bacterium]|nr:hypothetical protein [Lachnospiraceae bacterium]